LFHSDILIQFFFLGRAVETGNKMQRA